VLLLDEPFGALTRQQLADLALQVGQPVRLTSSRLRVFPLERQG